MSICCMIDVFVEDLNYRQIDSRYNRKKKKMTKILLYNWDRIDGHDGGGVTVYLKNIITHLCDNPNYKIFFLNSGLTYTRDRKICIRQISNSISKKILCYEILNSPIIAPVQQSIRNLEHYFEDETLYPLIKEFIEQQGEFDIIHFNNLEGLSYQVLQLKREYPKTRIIYSAHNYFPICSRVNLWKDEIKGLGHNCNKQNYEECAECYGKRNYLSVISRRRVGEKGIVGAMCKVATHIYDKTLPDSGDVNLYKQFEKKNIEAINNYMDCVLAVSKRVKDILVARGVKEEKIILSYIGTKVAENPMKHANTDLNADIFRIAYMGYMNDFKGFYFLLDALKKMPDEIAKKTAVHIIAKHDPVAQKKEIQELEKLKRKCADVILINGYTPNNQKQLLQGIHLGIIPVLWEDNLPQVAIEQVAYGVPILTSDLGGAAEIGNNSNFVFKAGNTQEFLQRVSYFYNNRQELNRFWDNAMELVTLDQHMKQLTNIYALEE